MQNSNIKCFDYPELDTVVMARPTMSLAMWYQIVGRAIRPTLPKNVAGLWIYAVTSNVLAKSLIYGCLIAVMVNG